MIRGLAPAAALLLLSGPGGARDLILSPPIACDLANTCFIQQYMDRDEGPGAADFTCNLLSYDGHSGTDFALPSTALIATGIAVIAAAPGTVKGMRDGMEDAQQGLPGAPDVTGRECGNGVLIDHGSGWETQYCHMKQGSVIVQKGQHVATGTPLGQVGMSGQAEFPHVHLTVRHDGMDVDPFHPDPTISCGEPPPAGLWQDPVIYVPGGIINIGFALDIPQFQAIKSGLPALPNLAATAPALVLWVHMFGSRAGDVVQITINGPNGPVLDQSITLEKPQARLFRAAGLRRPTGGWLPGPYQGTATLTRGTSVIDQQGIALTILP